MKRAVLLGMVVLAIGAAVVVAGWAYEHQVWMRDDYTSGYAYGSALPNARESGMAARRQRGTACWEQAQAHSTSGPAQVVFQAGCTDAGNGRDPRPEDAGGFVSDSLGLWGPFG